MPYFRINICQELKKAARGKKTKFPLEWLLERAVRESPDIHREITKPVTQRAIAKAAAQLGIYPFRG